MGNTNQELSNKIKLLEKKLESFSSNSEPMNGYYEGQTWWDKVNKQLKIWNGKLYNPLLTGEKEDPKYCICSVGNVTDAQTLNKFPISITSSSGTTDFTETTNDFIDILNTGKYIISFSCKFNRSTVPAGSMCNMGLYLNDTTLVSNRQKWIPGYESGYLTITSIINVTAGDTLSIKCYSNSSTVTKFEPETSFNIISL